MNEAAPHIRFQGGTEGSPYPYLYIYFLKGRMPKDGRACFDSSFIGAWEEEGTAFLFFTRPAGGQVARFLAEMPGMEIADRFEMSYEDWHGGPVLPFRSGSFLVMPPWRKIAPGQGDIPILLDPGVVFGAGSHPTTRHCLLAIDHLMSREKVESVLDLGAGTGLLAVAAAKLGARRTVAVDNNFLASFTALENIRHNRVADRAFSVCAKAEEFIDLDAELVVANIHYDVMQALLESPGFKKKKWFVLSGLLRTPASLVKVRLARIGAQIMDEWIQDGIWHTILAGM